MPTYTPSLIIAPTAQHRKERRLPVSGSILVEIGQEVRAEDVVARAERQGKLSIVHATTALGLDPSDLPRVLRVSLGQRVEDGDVLAEVQGFLGLFRSECRCAVQGSVEYASETSGHIGIRQPSIPIEVRAFVDGIVKDTIRNEGVIVESSGALIQGIYGIGGEKRGILHVAGTPTDMAQKPHGVSPLEVLVFPAKISQKELDFVLSSRNVVGVVVGGMTEGVLRRFSRPGEKASDHNGPTVILTEGFGNLEMQERTRQILESLEGHMASIDGTTQIRAGVIRPEIFVARPGTRGESPHGGSLELLVHARVRILTPPHFSQMGRVVEMPEPPDRIPTGSEVRVARVQLDSGPQVTIPRANIEVMA